MRPSIIVVIIIINVTIVTSLYPNKCEKASSTLLTSTILMPGAVCTPLRLFAGTMMVKSGYRALGRAIGRCAHQRLHLDEERAGAVDGHPDGGAAKRLVVLGQQHLAGVCHLAQASTWLHRDGRRYTPILIPTRSTSTHTAPS